MSIYRKSGAVAAVTGTNPAANAECSDSVPAGEVWELLAYSVACVQGITQTPQPILRITAGGVIVYESFGSTTAQAVSTTCRYSWAPGLTISGLIGATTNVHSVAGLPAGLILSAGDTIATVTVGIGANTDYGAPIIYVLKYS